LLFFGEVHFAKGVIIVNNTPGKSRQPSDGPRTESLDNMAIKADFDELLASLTPEQRARVNDNIGLVGLHIKNRVPTPDEPSKFREYDDLFQEGCIALVRAAVRFDPQTDGQFAAYALARIRGAIHSAIHEKFTIIHIPLRALMKLQQQDPDSEIEIIDPMKKPIVALHASVPVEVPIGSCSDRDDETVRHMIRRRFELAVSRAMEDLKKRKWRRRNPCAIMERIAAERLLISRDNAKTPLRQIARDAGVSPGRANSYEQLLLNTVREYFQNDPQVRVLVWLAKKDTFGFEAVVDEHRKDLLIRAEVDDFVERFKQMKPDNRAETLYSLVQQAIGEVEEVAANLYRLTISKQYATIPAIN